MTGIRRAAREDLAAIAMIHLCNMARMAEMAPAGLGQSLLTPPPLEQIVSYFNSVIDDDGNLLLAAETEAGIVGFLSASVENYPDDLLDSPYFTIEFVEIILEAEGRGLATALMQAAEQFARERGIASIDLSVWQGNDRAQELYERLGYSPLEIRMVKQLKD